VRSQLRDSLRVARRVEARDHDVGALDQQLGGYGASDAAIAACDDRDTSGETEVHS
jgi:hypothetical protein